MKRDILVAFFSVMGKTEDVARKLASVLDADLHKIEPGVPYTKEDLDLLNGRSRMAQEQIHRSIRPIIVSHVDNMEQYDVVFIGFPIWWDRQPNIVNTFLESYDFSGKLIVPFATGTSGSSWRDITSYRDWRLNNAVVVEGRRFSRKCPESILKVWAYEQIDKNNITAKQVIE